MNIQSCLTAHCEGSLHRTTPPQAEEGRCSPDILIKSFKKFLLVHRFVSKVPYKI